MTDRKPKQTLVATDPDGGVHKIRTAARYDWAGLASTKPGKWDLVSKGWSYRSVLGRASAKSPLSARIEAVPFKVSAKGGA